MVLDLIYCLLGLPFLAGVVVAFGGKWPEKTVAKISLVTVMLYSCMAILLLGSWLTGGERHMDLRAFDLYKTDKYSFPIAFYVDSMSIAFILLVAFLSGIVIKYSTYYMHREPGYQKFFGCLLFFIFGLTLLTLAGTLDLLMAGWEFVGICSFLLISFYQTRLNSVRNAFKVLSVYKFCDVGLLLGACLSHLLWHETQFFSVLNSALARAQMADISSWKLMLMTVMILIAAAGKSAQWPFSFWISRAMEGPTPSSAIFYGALSVHAGVLLLHRTHPIWSATAYGPWLVGALGLTTAIVCSGIGNVQSNIKGQIAYSSAANVGLMFVEMALNLKGVVIIHMAANATLRCYQLLISPSAMAYLLRLQGSDNLQLTPMGGIWTRFLPKRINQSFYIFCLNDGYLEELVRFLIWMPIKRAGMTLQKFDRSLYWIVFPILFISIGILKVQLTEDVREPISILCAILMLALATTAFSERRSALRAWNTASLSALFAGVTVVVMEPSTADDILIYASSITLFWVIGFQSLLFMADGIEKLNLQFYRGMSASHPGGSVLLLVAILGVSGFPISPVYIGQDILLHHAAGADMWLVLAIALTIVINGISLARIYLKVCMGEPGDQQKRKAHENGKILDLGYNTKMWWTSSPAKTGGEF